MAFVVKVNGPGDKCAMIRGRPGIRCKVDLASVVLENVIDAFATMLKGSFDVTPDGGGRWYNGGGTTSFHQSYELPIGNDLGWARTFDAPMSKMGPSFIRCVSTVGDFDRGLALTRKESKDRSIALFGCWFGPKCRLDNILTEAADSVGLEIGGRTSILGVLVTTHTVESLVAAALRCALEEMILATLVVADGDVTGEELVDGGAPALL